MHIDDIYVQLYIMKKIIDEEDLYIYIYIYIYHITSQRNCLIQQICMYKVQTPYINLMGWAIIMMVLLGPSYGFLTAVRFTIFFPQPGLQTYQAIP